MSRLAIVSLVVALVVGYWPLLDCGFYSDDFAILQYNRDLGWGGFFDFLLFADYGDRPWAYWRPGWALAFWLIQEVAGPSPFAFHLTSLVLHVVCSLIVFWLAMTTTRSRFAALTAGLLFGLTDAHVEAVAWPCAALNVIPAAIPILLATRLAWRFALDGGAWRLGAMTLLMVASLTFKEAAYGIPLVLGATLLTARDRRDGWSRRDRQIVLTIAVQAGIVLFHYLARNNVAGVAGGAMVTTVAAAVHANAYLASHVPVSGIWLPLILAALVALVVFVTGSRATRFYVLCTLAGMFPYVAMTHGERFLYFFNAPLALCLAQVAVDLRRRINARWFSGILPALLLAIIAWDARELREKIADAAAASESCRDVLETVRELELAEGDEVIVDVVPPFLNNALEPMVELDLGYDVKASCLELLPMPPFMIYVNDRTASIDAETPTLIFDEQTQRYVRSTFGDRIGALVPHPLFALPRRFRVVADSDFDRQITNPDWNPSEVALLDGAPSPAPSPTARARFVSVHTDIRRMGATVECSEPVLFVVAFPLPMTRFDGEGKILVDGESVPVLRANRNFHAVALPSGTHTIVLRPTFGR